MDSIHKIVPALQSTILVPISSTTAYQVAQVRTPDQVIVGGSSVSGLLVGSEPFGELPGDLGRGGVPGGGSDVGRMYDFGSDDDSFIEDTPRVAFQDGLLVDSSDLVVTKRSYSSFVGTELLGLLCQMRVEAVAICGMMTSFCYESTARDAFGLGFETLFVRDAVGW